MELKSKEKNVNDPRHKHEMVNTMNKSKIKKKNVANSKLNRKMKEKINWKRRA